MHIFQIMHRPKLPFLHEFPGSYTPIRLNRVSVGFDFLATPGRFSWLHIVTSMTTGGLACVLTAPKMWSKPPCVRGFIVSIHQEISTLSVS